MSNPNASDASEDAAAEQVRRVRWRLICSIAQTSKQKRTSLYEWHRQWVDHLQSLHPHWPLDNILEMLLLTEGSPSEVDAAWMEFARGVAAGTTIVVVNGVNRDYLKFLSVLHARHQQRIAKGNREESAEDRERRIRREQNESWKRTFKNGGW